MIDSNDSAKLVDLLMNVLRFAHETCDTSEIEVLDIKRVVFRVLATFENRPANCTAYDCSKLWKWLHFVSGDERWAIICIFCEFTPHLSESTRNNGM